MATVLFLFATLVAPLQDDPKALVEKLRAERPEDREDARRKLKALGAAVLPELERVARSPDAEAAAQARLLIRVIDLTRLLSPRLLQELPGIEEKLATGGDDAWTEALLTAAGKNEGRLILLTSSDLQPLAERAARGAKTAEQKQAIIEVSRRYSLHSAAPTIRGFLADAHPLLRRTAAETLSVLRYKEAIPDILKLIDDDFDERYFYALYLLEAKTELIGLLDHRESAVRAAAVYQLSAWREMKPHILKMLKDPVLSVRGKAAGAAGRAMVKEAIPLIVPLLQNEDFDQVYHALHALADLEAKEAIPDIMKVLDREGQIRGEAAVALSSLKAKEAIPKILPHLKDPDGNVQMRVAGSLGRLGAKEAIPGLVEMTKGDNFVLRQTGLRALVDLMGKEAAPHLRRLLTDSNRSVANDALETTINLQLRELLPDLLAMVESAPTEDVVDAIARLGGREQVPLMLKLTEDKDAGTRASALWGLGHLGAVEHRARIDAKLKDADPEVRAAAAEALGQLRARESIPGIEALLSDRIDKTALTAAKALCLLGSKKGAPLLLENPEEMVHLNALRSPEEWKRFEADSRNGYRDGTGKELAEEVAAQAKLMVDWPKDLSEALRSRLAEPRTADAWKWTAGLSIRDVFSVLIPNEMTFILESGRLRVVTRTAAQAFWRDWLAK